MSERFDIRAAARGDVAAIHAMVRELAEYEKLTDLCVSTAAQIEQELFGDRRNAEALIAREAGEPVGFALYFHNYSTFLGRKGLYLEDLFVRPAHRRRGCGRFEWMALDWNEPALDFYRQLGASEMSEWRLLRVTGDALARLAASR